MNSIESRKRLRPNERHINYGSFGDMMRLVSKDFTDLQASLKQNRCLSREEREVLLEDVQELAPFLLFGMNEQFHHMIPDSNGQKERAVKLDTGNHNSNARHAKTALRLFIIALHLTITSPQLAFYCCITLFSTFSLYCSPSNASKKQMMEVVLASFTDAVRVLESASAPLRGNLLKTMIDVAKIALNCIDDGSISPITVNVDQIVKEAMALRAVHEVGSKSTIRASAFERAASALPPVLVYVDSSERLLSLLHGVLHTVSALRCDEIALLLPPDAVSSLVHICASLFTLQGGFAGEWKLKYNASLILSKLLRAELLDVANDGAKLFLGVLQSADVPRSGDECVKNQQNEITRLLFGLLDWYLSLPTERFADLMDAVVELGGMQDVREILLHFRSVCWRCFSLMSSAATGSAGCWVADNVHLADSAVQIWKRIMMIAESRFARFSWFSGVFDSSSIEQDVKHLLCSCVQCCFLDAACERPEMQFSPLRYLATMPSSRVAPALDWFVREGKDLLSASAALLMECNAVAVRVRMTQTEKQSLSETQENVDKQLLSCWKDCVTLATSHQSPQWNLVLSAITVILYHTREGLHSQLLSGLKNVLRHFSDKKVGSLLSGAPAGPLYLFYLLSYRLLAAARQLNHNYVKALTDETADANINFYCNLCALLQTLRVAAAVAETVANDGNPTHDKGRFRSWVEEKEMVLLNTPSEELQTPFFALAETTLEVLADCVAGQVKHRREESCRAAIGAIFLSCLQQGCSLAQQLLMIGTLHHDGKQSTHATPIPRRASGSCHTDIVNVDESDEEADKQELVSVSTAGNAVETVFMVFAGNLRRRMGNLIQEFSSPRWSAGSPVGDAGLLSEGGPIHDASLELVCGLVSIVQMSNTQDESVLLFVKSEAFFRAFDVVPEAASFLLRQIITAGLGSSVISGVFSYHHKEGEALDDAYIDSFCERMDFLFPLGEDGVAGAAAYSSSKWSVQHLRWCSAKSWELDRAAATYINDCSGFYSFSLSARRTSAMAKTLVTATKILAATEQSIEDVSRFMPFDFFLSPLFEHLCSAMSTTVKTVATSILHLLSAHLDAQLQSGDLQYEERIFFLTKSCDISPHRLLAAFAANVLYKGTSLLPEKKMEKLRAIAGALHLKTDEALRHLHNRIAVLSFYMLQLNADAQLSYVEEKAQALRRQESSLATSLHNMENVNYAALKFLPQELSFFDLDPAMGCITHFHAVSPSESSLLQCMQNSEKMLLPQTFTFVVFVVFDFFFAELLAHTAGSGEDSGSSTRAGQVRAGDKTCKRLIVALVSFLRLIGDRCQMALPKLFVLLDALKERKEMTPYAVLLWREVADRISPNALVEYAGSMVSQLLALEHQIGEVAGGREELKRILQRIHGETGHLEIWNSFYVLVRERSPLLQEVLSLREAEDGKMLSARNQNGNLETPLLPQTFPQHGSDAAAAVLLLRAFLIGIGTKSVHCKTTVVRGFHECLCSLSAIQLLSVSHVASTSPLLLPALWRCAHELPESVGVLILEIIGKIGAAERWLPCGLGSGRSPLEVTPRLSTAKSASMLAESVELQALAMKLLTSPHNLEFASVVKWRYFVQILLGRWAPRAFSRVTDRASYDCAGFAVQEVLRWAVAEERRVARKVELGAGSDISLEELSQYEWWSNLTAVQEELSPFAKSNYVVKERDGASAHGGVVFRVGLTYTEWLFGFFNTLLLHCSKFFVEFVRAFRNTAKQDKQLMLFLVCHMIVDILLHSEGQEDAAVKYVGDEMEEVLKCCSLVDSGAQRSGDETAAHFSEASTGQQGSGAVASHVLAIMRIMEDIAQLRWSLLSYLQLQAGSGSPAAVSNEIIDLPKTQVDALARHIQGFLEQRSLSLRCSAAHRHGGFLNCLRALESVRYLPSPQDAMAVFNFQQLFHDLGDLESAKGASFLVVPQTSEEKARSFASVGDFVEAQRLCEVALQRHPGNASHEVLLLNSMHHLGQFSNMLLRSSHFLSDLEHRIEHQEERVSWQGSGGGYDLAVRTHKKELVTLRNEAAWRLGKWDAVAEVPDLAPSVASSVKCFASIFSEGKTSPGFQSKLENLLKEERKKILFGSSLESSGVSSLATESFRLLHALEDIHLMGSIVLAQSDGKHVTRGRSFGEAVDFLSRRRTVTQASVASRELLLSLHRTFYEMRQDPKGVVESLLEYGALLRDEELFSPALFVTREAESALQNASAEELLGGDLHTELLGRLRLLMSDFHLGKKSGASTAGNRATVLAEEGVSASVRAELIVRTARHMVETESATQGEILHYFNEACHIDPQSEQAPHHLGLFYHKLFTAEKTRLEVEAGANVDTLSSHTGGNQRSQSSSSLSVSVASPDKLKELCRELEKRIEQYAVESMKCFGLALLRGKETVVISLPRLLTLWLECTEFLKANEHMLRTHQVLLNELTDIVKRLFLSTSEASISPAVAITAFSQLLSRLSHPDPSVIEVIIMIVIHVMNYFPQQGLWQVLPIAFSENKHRSEKARRYILGQMKNSEPRQKAHLEAGYSIFMALREICTSNLSSFAKGSGLTQIAQVKALETALPDMRFILPLLQTLTPNVYADELRDVFPVSPCFAKFEDRLTVMSSLQKPKRIFVIAETGEEYSFLCKAKDEPRKDIRMMEVAGLINSLFLANTKASQKGFSLRRYSVAALNDDCAVIQWVNHTKPIRSVVGGCYALDGSGVRMQYVKSLADAVESRQLTKKDMFARNILLKARPVLHQWFDCTFPTNQAWYEARRRYTQSVALWSMAGHIVGLGDRHAENLMLDITRGELNHVDFACMFDRGETLEVPERVRFRLTQNIVDGMGILGTEGPFRYACEVALRCQVQNKEALMSIVETLIHDPLVEWQKANSSRSASKVNPAKLMYRVSRRLDGFLDFYSKPQEWDSVSLNTERAVDKLIQHSSSLDNLVEMYVWWMAWI